ncbi:MAG: class I SAM-dependent methyltransferase [Candidatus Electrothrix sp. AW1]|nr:class I SAM-dependent methyltransferase [Candidatus Electrothrix sp. AX1]MCI5182302.1 class I SAM-dependent methyltransferase [Candidatus Electrothrix gigas]
MAQQTSHVYSILSVPFFYNLLQKILGSKNGRTEFVNKYMCASPDDRILDIGCGTAEILDYLPNTYVGFDASSTYIEAAKKRYQHKNAQFFSRLVTELELHKFEPFNIVIATGILHHLEDNEVVHLFSLAKKFLAQKGRVVTIDPCYLEKQRGLAKFIINRDRGQNIRTPSQYKDLAEKVMPNVSLTVRGDLLRIPYDHAILKCNM